MLDPRVYYYFNLLVSFFWVVVWSAPAVIAYLIHRRWQQGYVRREEINRLLVLALEETARAEFEASSMYVGADTISVAEREFQCAVCFFPTTNRCSGCKSVHYWHVAPVVAKKTCFAISHNRTLDKLGDRRWDEAPTMKTTIFFRHFCNFQMLKRKQNSKYEEKKKIHMQNVRIVNKKLIDENSCKRMAHFEGKSVTSHSSSGDMVFEPILEEGVFRFDCSATDREAAFPSLSFIEAKFRDTPIISNRVPAYNPSFECRQGQQIVKIQLPTGTSLYETGEVSGQLERTGKRIFTWNTDAWGYGSGTTSLYQSHP